MLVQGRLRSSIVFYVLKLCKKLVSEELASFLRK